MAKKQGSSAPNSGSGNQGRNRKSPNSKGPVSATQTAQGQKADIVNGNGFDGDCDNGKLRCKSLIIDSTKYRTLLNQKFEKRRPWVNPDQRKIMSNIPGTVIKIYVKEGQEVKEGDQMLILEAMKMKNKIRFHTGGTVKSILVKEGEKVRKDHLMVELK